MSVNLKTVFSNPAVFLMTGFGAGLSPKAPGTVGSLLGLLLFIPVLSLPIYFQFLIVAFGLSLGVVLSQRVADELRVKDPAIIVWDEFVGIWIAMLWLPGLLWLPVAFIIFRLFDILKPWPVSWVERQLDGGFGIMLDDVIAGMMTIAVLQLLAYLSPL